MDPTGSVAGAEWYDPDAYDRVARDLERDGWTVLTFDGGHDVAALFREFKATLPLDPPISGRVNWDAFADSLWSGLNDLKAMSIALVWRGAGQLRHSDPASYQVAEDVLGTAAAQLTAGEYGARPGRVVRLFYERRSAATPNGG